MNREQLLEAVKNIPIASEHEEWSITLDKEEGSLFYAPKDIPDGTHLHQITDEFALYIDKDLNPKGVVVEYYQANFLQHHNKVFKKISSDVFKESDSDEVVTINSRQMRENENAGIFKALLETTLIKDAGMNPLAV